MGETSFRGGSVNMGVSSNVFPALSALVTAAVALVLGVAMAIQYVQRHRTNTFWWGLSFLVTAVAALLQFLSLSQGAWAVGAYRVYVVTSAAVPALMGAGSMYLLWRRLAPVYTVVILAFIALTVAGALTATLNPALLGSVMKASQQVTLVLPSPLVILGFAVLGTFGAAALVLGALWSFLKTRGTSNLGIAFGGVVFSLGDTLAANGVPELFFVAEIVGVLAIFLAVRAAQRPRDAQLPVASENRP